MQERRCARDALPGLSFFFSIFFWGGRARKLELPFDRATIFTTEQPHALR